MQASSLIPLALLLGLHWAAALQYPHQNSSQETVTAEALAGKWGLTSWRSFLETAGDAETVDSVLRFESHSSLVVAVLGDKESKPIRRNVSAGQPFLDHSELSAEDARMLGLEALNKGAPLLEAALGRPLYPFVLRPVDMQPAEGRSGGFAVWNVSSGELHIDKRVFESAAASLQSSAGLLTSFASATMQQLSRIARVENSTSAVNVLVATLASKAVPASIALAVASAGPPIWFCIACPIVLGLLAPFAFNIGFGSAASMICQHYNLPAQECNDLWYGAFALAMVLSLASAVPIAYICQLPKCGRRT